MLERVYERLPLARLHLSCARETPQLIDVEVVEPRVGRCVHFCVKRKAAKFFIVDTFTVRRAVAVGCDERGARDGPLSGLTGCPADVSACAAWVRESRYRQLFFCNLGEVSNVVNNVLQAKPGDAFNDFGRLFINSNVGVGGVFDVASSLGLPEHQEDFGQTLAT